MLRERNVGNNEGLLNIMQFLDVKIFRICNYAVELLSGDVQRVTKSQC